MTASFETEPLIRTIPPNWSGLEHLNQELRFVDESYVPEDCRAVLERMGILVSIEARTMSLREIFVSTTRRRRAESAVSS